MKLAIPRPHLLAAALLGVLCAVAFGRTVGAEFVRWDDGLLIYENAAARGFSWVNIKAAFTTYDPELWIPWTLLSYQLDYTIGGTHPLIYHLHNILGHIGAAIAVYASFFLLTKKHLVAFLTALLFAIHPLNTEAVAWASGRKDVLSAMYFFLALACALRGEEKQDRRWYWASVGLVAIAMMSKATAVVFPGVLVLIDWYQHKPLFTWRQVRRYVPYAMLSAAILVIAIYGKTGVLGSSDLTEKLLMAPRSLMFYLQTIVWPRGLAVLYPWEGAVSLMRPVIAGSIALLAALTAAAAGALRWSRLPLFALGFFVLGIAPTLVNFAKGDFTFFASDRYAYIGAVGVFFLLASALDWLLRRRPAREYAAVTAVIGLILLPLSFVQAKTWMDSPSLFGNVIALYPTTVIAHNNLGNYERERGNRAAALTRYEEALRLLEIPDVRQWHSDRVHSRLLSNYAAAVREGGDTGKARSLLTEALALDPNGTAVHLQLGILLASQGDLDTAEWHYRRAAALDPAKAATPLVNLGAVHMARGESAEAAAAYERALGLNPFYPQAWYNLGIAERSRDRPRQARAAYERAVALAPEFVAARINLAILYYERQWVEQAVEQFRAVLHYDPQNARALSALRQMGVQ